MHITLILEVSKCFRHIIMFLEVIYQKYSYYIIMCSSFKYFEIKKI